MTAIDPVAWLRATPPFDALPQPVFDAAARTLEVRSYPAGARLVRAGGTPLEHLYVVRAGAVRLERDGQVLQVVEEGETFGYTSLLTRQAALDVVVEQDLLAYRLPAPEFRRLLEDARFARHFATGLAGRLTSTLDRFAPAESPADLTAEARGLVTREPVWVDGAATVGDAAHVMRRERISSVLVRGEPPGIVTDRDLRNRVLAEGLGPETPVARVLSRPLRTVPASAPVHHAWTALLDARVHHLALTEGEAISGVITSTDLLRASAQGPVSLLRRVDGLGSRADLPGWATGLTAMTSALLAGGVPATAIAGLVARLDDALLRRMLAWAEAELGPPPAPFAWIVFGSEGRMEQTALTDQDNALIHGEVGPGEREWFQRFAERVNGDLETAGFPPCDGGYMARRWNGPLSEWTERFAGWIDVPRPEAILVASIFFDFRPVGGGLDLAPLEAALAEIPRRPLFLRHLAADALHFRPPPSLLVRLRGEASTVDLKRHGVTAIASLARCYGLEAGTGARGTLERLDAARRAGLLGDETHATVAEAFRFLLTLRLRAQLRRSGRGAPPGSKVALAELSAIERSRLKEALRALRAWQDEAAEHYQTAPLQ